MKELEKKMCFLRDVSRLKKRDRVRYLSACKEKNIHIICECLFNIIKGNCGKKYIKNGEFKNLLKKLSNPKVSTMKKRVLMTSQHGRGIFSLIARTAIPFLLSLLSKK